MQCCAHTVHTSHTHVHVLSSPSLQTLPGDVSHGQTTSAASCNQSVMTLTGLLTICRLPQVALALTQTSGPTMAKVSNNGAKSLSLLLTTDLANTLIELYLHQRVTVLFSAL